MTRAPLRASVRTVSGQRLSAQIMTPKAPKSDWCTGSARPGRTFLSWDWYTRESREWYETSRGAQAAGYAEGYKIASWAILGSLLAVMVAGVIDALVFYEDPGTQWRLLAPEEVPEDRRLPVRDPAEFLPPPPAGPDEALPAAATIGWSFPLGL